MAQLKPISQLLPIYATSAFWGTYVLLQTIWRIIVLGPKKFFSKKKREIRPEILDDPELGTHQFARLKTINLHYVISGPEDKPLMLFLHGFPEFWYSWRHQIKEFSKDYRTVAVDMRGYGESDKPSGVHQYSMATLVADIEELIEYLGYKKCTLVAHDWGGAVAWSFSHFHPELVEKLIVCNCPNSMAFQKHLQSSRKQLLKSWYMFFFQIPYFPEMMIAFNDLAMIEDAFVGPSWGAKKGFANTDIEAYKFNFRNAAAVNGPLNYYRASMRYRYEKPPTKTVKVPTLIVWGTADGALDTEMAKLSCNSADDCRVHYIDGASHWVQQEEPEKVNQAIRAYLSGEELKE